MYFLSFQLSDKTSLNPTGGSCYTILNCLFGWNMSCLRGNDFTIDLSDCVGRVMFIDLFSRQYGRLSASVSVKPQQFTAIQWLLNTLFVSHSVQVICVDWSNLAGKGYVILNMTDNFDCVSAAFSQNPNQNSLANLNPSTHCSCMSKPLAFSS